MCRAFSSFPREKELAETDDLTRAYVIHYALPIGCSVCPPLLFALCLLLWTLWCCPIGCFPTGTTWFCFNVLSQSHLCFECPTGNQSYYDDMSTWHLILYTHQGIQCKSFLICYKRAWLNGRSGIGTNFTMVWNIVLLFYLTWQPPSFSARDLKILPRCSFGILQ